MLKIQDNDFKRLVTFIQTNYGINLTQKRTLIEGRLNNILVERGYSDYTSFLDMCFADKTGKEIDKLLNKLTTNTTYFMREPEHFEFLNSTVLPFIKEKNEATKTMRIWSAGCSSGAEAYTTVMHISEFLGSEKPKWDTRLLATDISHNILGQAQAGIYDGSGLKDVSQEWLAKYFTQLSDGRYKIKDRLRKEVIFREFNLMEEIPFKKAPFDLIFCRNVMIYFDAETKLKLVNRFYDVLRPGGYLFIGHAESIPRDTTNYEYIKPAVYRRPL